MKLLNAIGLESVILLVIAVLFVGAVVVGVTGLNHPSGTGVHIGQDVEDAGTNPWQ